MINKAEARRAARLRKHPPKPGSAAKKPVKPVKPIPSRTPRPPRQGWGRGRDLSQFLPKDK
jgi:hypothetical protein